MTNKADCYTGCGIFALAVAAYCSASALPAATSGLGAGGFPKFIAFCLGILGIIQAVTSYKKMKKHPGEDKKVLHKDELLGVLIMVIAFGLYIALVKPLGYILSTIIFLNIFFYIYGERKPVRMIIISVCFSVICYYLFKNVFYVMLPAGTLF